MECGSELQSGQLASPLFNTASYDFCEQQNPDRSCDNVDRHARGRSFSQLSTSGGLAPKTRFGCASSDAMDVLTAEVWRLLMAETMSSRGIRPFCLKGATEAPCFEERV